MTKKEILAHGKKVIEVECRNLNNMQRRLDGGFVKAVELIMACRGKVVVTGMGKSGIIGRKISGTLASTGTPAAFLHPGEAIHGDLGMVSARDIVLAISNSGASDEILKIVPSLKKIGATIIALTASAKSALGCKSDLTVETGEIEEADSFGLVPSSSAACALVLGDALALTLLSLKGFGKRDYALYHPGGSLGRRLMLKVADVMQAGNKIPKVSVADSLCRAIAEINEKNLGFTLVTDRGGVLKGIITDGDLRRLLAGGAPFDKISIAACMTKNPRTIGEDRLAVEALSLMERLEITTLAILDEKKRPKGFVHLHDLLGKKEFSVEL